MLKGNKILLRSLTYSDLNFLKSIENNIDNWHFGSEEKKFSNNELTNYIENTKDYERTKEETENKKKITTIDPYVCPEFEPTNQTISRVDLAYVRACVRASERGETISRL